MLPIVPGSAKLRQGCVLFVQYDDETQATGRRFSGGGADLTAGRPRAVCAVSIGKTVAGYVGGCGGNRAEVEFAAATSCVCRSKGSARFNEPVHHHPGRSETKDFTNQFTRGLRRTIRA